MFRVVPLLGTLAMAGCLTAPQVDERACADICAKQASTEAPGEQGGAPAMALSGFEQDVLGPLVEDIRAGVRPFDDQSLGICPKGENSRKCDQMLGMTPGELPEGEYILYGSFAVPNVGERGTWKIKLEIDCETTKASENGDSKTTSNWSKEYDVVFAGKDRGYTLSPMRRITSPNPNGAQACTFKIIGPHPDGEKVYEGSWSVPAGE